jgi:IS1 family transposase
MLCEGLGIRAASRLTGTDQKTVLNILKSAGEHCAQFMDDKLRNLKPEAIEVDECWTFVNNRRTKNNTPTTGDFYALLASGQNSKLVVSYMTGKRDHATANNLISDLRSRSAGRFQITSDGFSGFVRGVLDNNADSKMDYAVQIKRYDRYNAPADSGFGPAARGKCVAVKTIPISGHPQWNVISTSHAERLNLSLRHFNKRFTRLSPCFSKKLENLAHSVSLTVAHFNFCRAHKSLKIKATDDTSSVERSPAMAAGLTDHIWPVDELLSAKAQ